MCCKILQKRGLHGSWFSGRIWGPTPRPALWWAGRRLRCCFRPPQWNLAIPYNAVTGSTTIQIGTSAPFPITLSQYAPVLFSVDGSGEGNVMAQRVLGSSTPTVSASAPAFPGDTIVLYATGLGAIDANGNTIPLPTVTVGGQAVTVV